MIEKSFSALITMSRSLRVARGYIQQVKMAVKRNGFPSQKAFAIEIGLSRATVGNFLNGTPVDYLNFVEICEKLGLDWQEIAARDGLDGRALAEKQDWGEAPDVKEFWGRTHEGVILKRWILDDKCRLVALLGIGGIGKTAFSVKLAREMSAQFEYIIWRSLQYLPPLEKILADLIYILSGQQEQEMDLPDNLGDLITMLIGCLRSSRCLLILDNFQSIFISNDFAGSYLAGYGDYGQLLQRVANEQHQSCLAIVSREKTTEIALNEGEKFPVRSLRLDSLRDDAREIMRAKGLCQEQEWDTLINYFGGNPLKLKLVATVIKDLFDGSVSKFLNMSDTLMLHNILHLIDEQFSRLSPLEKNIMYCLAISEAPVSLQKMPEYISSPLAQREWPNAMQSLSYRAMIEEAADGFTLQPVVREYAIAEALVNQVCKEIVALSQNEEIDSMAIVKIHQLHNLRVRGDLRQGMTSYFFTLVKEKLCQEYFRSNIKSG